MNNIDPNGYAHCNPDSGQCFGRIGETLPNLSKDLTSFTMVYTNSSYFVTDPLASNNLDVTRKSNSLCDVCNSYTGPNLQWSDYASSWVDYQKALVLCTQTGDVDACGFVAAWSALAGSVVVALGTVVGYVATDITSTAFNYVSFLCLKTPWCARIVASTIGIKVFRIWGVNSLGAGAKQLGSSWTPIDPRTVVDFANAAGLPRRIHNNFLLGEF